MKHIEVVAAIIQRDGAYFATQRGYGEFGACGSFLVERLNQAKAVMLHSNEKSKRNWELISYRRSNMYDRV